MENCFRSVSINQDEKEKQVRGEFIPIPHKNSRAPGAQWKARWTSNLEVEGSNPADDDFDFRCFSLFQKFTKLFLFHTKHDPGDRS